MKISQRIRSWLQEGEDILTSLLGLIIAISGLIAFADVFSSGKALAFVPWLLWVWIVLQAIAVDYMFYVSAKRQFTAQHVDRFVYWTRWVLIAVLGALVVFVGAIFAVNETQGGAMASSMAVLGIPTIAFMYARAISPVLLLFVIAVDHAMNSSEQQPAQVQSIPDVDTLVDVIVERVTVHLEQRNVPAIAEVSTVDTDVDTDVDTLDSTEQQIRALLDEDNTLSARTIAQRVGCSPTTASKWKNRIEQSA